MNVLSVFLDEDKEHQPSRQSTEQEKVAEIQSGASAGAGYSHLNQSDGADGAPKPMRTDVSSWVHFEETHHPPSPVTSKADNKSS